MILYYILAVNIKKWDLNQGLVAHVQPAGEDEVPDDGEDEGADDYDQEAEQVARAVRGNSYTQTYLICIYNLITSCSEPGGEHGGGGCPGVYGRR